MIFLSIIALALCFDHLVGGGEPIYAAYLIFVIFLHKQNFWRIKFTPKKRVNYDKYTVNCQFFALLRQNTQ